MTKMIKFFFSIFFKTSSSIFLNCLSGDIDCYIFFWTILHIAKHLCVTCAHPLLRTISNIALINHPAGVLMITIPLDRSLRCVTVSPVNITTFFPNCCEKLCCQSDCMNSASASFGVTYTHFASGFEEKFLRMENSGYTVLRLCVGVPMKMVSSELYTALNS